MIVRLPQVHGDGDHAFVPLTINLALEKGASFRYHAVAEEGVPFRAIAEVTGRRLNVPVVSKTAEEAAAHFGWFIHFASADMPASSVKTRAELGWRPTGPGLLPDIDRPVYFEQ